ncbi:FAD-dependent oxidoreductase [Arthrobacter sp. I2-34]|uniref:FAD-dependent oxidoreductase n=1 Tax=Arthrobacter hankyongi TaxID=2904801 RepID=A0ABS9L7V3_9MICC|nr:FAD-dependent oxidoreductase [Arthrobacter hankyongi]MCG2622749.1 FAD-dependent oxidoreductase [Arthrobacter hankyongi]
MSSNHIIIAGAGLAGATAAKTLREEGFDGKLTLVGAETEYPYLRPPLSKAFLAGKESAEDGQIQAPAWYDEQDIDVKLDEAVDRIDAAAHRVVLSRGGALSYSKLLVATGASSRRLDISGAGLEGVHYLRTIDDSRALHNALARGDRQLVIIGMGWIGMEAAATARQLGNAVTVVGPGEVPLASALGPQIGSLFTAKHRAEGVGFRTGRTPVEIAAAGGKAAAVVLDDGERLAADLVLVAVGAVPNTALAEASGLAVSRGIDTDGSLLTSAADVYAAGDVANAFHPVLGTRLRSEHWANAIAQGTTAAKAMLGQDAVNDDIPYFYTDQFDIGMEYSGFFPWATSVPVIRGNPENMEFIAFWLRDSKVVAGMNVNVWDVQDAIQDLIRSARPVSVAELSDPAKELTSL